MALTQWPRTNKEFKSGFSVFDGRQGRDLRLQLLVSSLQLIIASCNIELKQSTLLIISFNRTIDLTQKCSLTAAPNQ